LAKLFAKFMNRIGIRNAPSASLPKRGGGGAINRDPKAVQVKRVGYQISNAQGGGGNGRDNFESPKVDFTVIEQAIERDSYILQSVMKYEELIFKSGYGFQSKNDQALQYLQLRLDAMSIATQVSTEELYHGIARDIVRFSNAFIVKARAKGGKGLMPGITATAVPPAKDPVAGYFLLPPSTMQIARDQNGNITGYQQQVPGGNNTVKFRPEDIIHIKVNVPSGEAFGLPFLAPVLDDVRLLRKIEENAALLLYRHIFPLLAYTVGLDKPGFEATDEELDEIRQAIENMPTDGALVLPERHKIDAINISTIDGKPYLDYFEQRVFTGLGMSTVDMGRGDTANRNTADAMGGIKADRVKGWQQQIEAQLNKYLFEELLVEGGYDPVANPDLAVRFQFNEIESEMRIKLDTHEIYKFEHNIQTWDETRKNMKLDPTVDESRLYFNMVQIPLAIKTAEAKASAVNASSAGTPETNNKQKPANQHGTRSGPKRSTESNFVDIQENVLQAFPTRSIPQMTNKLNTIYQQMEDDVLSEIKRRFERRSYPLKDIKTMVSSIYFGKERMKDIVQKEARPIFIDGAKQAMKETKRKKMPSIDASLALKIVTDSAVDSFKLIETSLHDLLVKKLEGIDEYAKAMITAKGIFESLRYRLQFISKTLLMKTYQYGYILGLSRYGESAVHVVVSENECEKCQEKAGLIIQLSNLSHMDEIALWYRIPPFHPNCECGLELEQEMKPTSSESVHLSNILERYDQLALSSGVSHGY